MKNEHIRKIHNREEFKPGSTERVICAHEGKSYTIIRGALVDGGQMADELYIYNREIWPADMARNHAQSSGGEFEPALDAAKPVPKRSTQGVKRTYKFNPVEIRAVSGESEPLITGYAAVFNDISDAGRYWREQIAPGAFAKSLPVDDVRALFNHDPNCVLGRNIAGTLTLKEDEKGLFSEIKPPQTTVANDLIISMQRGDIDQMSFAFDILDESWQFSATDWKEDLLTIKEVKLYDVSIVTYPFYENTEAQVNSYFSAMTRSAISAEPPKRHNPYEINIRRMKLSALEKGIKL